jgi:hypothetical protein
VAAYQDSETLARQQVTAGRDAYVARGDIHLHFESSAESRAAPATAAPGTAPTAEAAWITLAHELESRLDLDDWNYHIGGLLRTFPGMRSSSNARLHDIARWLQGRVFPENQEELRRVFVVLPRIIVDLLDVFGEHYEVPLPEQDDPWLRTAQFYKLNRDNPDASRQYDDHVDLISDLALELTRVVNWFCDTVRRDLDRMFRLQHGAVQVEGGPFPPNGDTSWFLPKYSAAELSDAAGPYVTIDDFMTKRHARDLSFKPDSSR